MPRQARAAPGGIVYHIINRGVGRMTLFEKDGDYAAFEHCLRLAQDACPVELFCYCIMPNHWHLVVRPPNNGDLSAFMQRLTIRHARRWQDYRGVHGTGHVYQGRYKSFPIEADDHFLTVARYVERNALRASLVKRAEHWRWGSLHQRAKRTQSNDDNMPVLARWPVTRPSHWMRLVNTPQRESELTRVRQSVQRGRPFGGDRWVAKTATSLGIESTLRPPGRPWPK